MVLKHYANHNAFLYQSACQGWVMVGPKQKEVPLFTSQQHMPRAQRWVHGPRPPCIALGRTWGWGKTWTWPYLPELLYKLDKVLQGSFLAPWAHGLATGMGSEFQFPKATLSWVPSHSTQTSVGFGLRQLKEGTKLQLTSVFTSHHSWGKGETAANLLGFIDFTSKSVSV